MNKSLQTCHLLTFEDNDGIRTLLLKEDAYSLGRDKYNKIVFLTSKAVSRNHAMLLRTSTNSFGQTYQIVDGDANGQRSTNGLIINGVRCHSHQLVDGDEILLGSVKVLYQIQTIDDPDHQTWQLNSEDIFIDSSHSRQTKATLVKSGLDLEVSAPLLEWQAEEDEIPVTAFFHQSM